MPSGVKADSPVCCTSACKDSVVNSPNAPAADLAATFPIKLSTTPFAANLPPGNMLAPNAFNAPLADAVAKACVISDQSGSALPRCLAKSLAVGPTI